MFKKRIRLSAAPTLHGRKRLVPVVLLCLMLLFACAQADTVTYGKQLTVDTSAEYVDFGDVHISDWTKVGDFLRKLPNLKRCDMFGTYIYKKYCDQLAAEFPEVEFGWTIRFGTPDAPTPSPEKVSLTVPTLRGLTLTLTDLTDMDPEQTSRGYPIQRSYGLTLNLGF